MTGTTVYTITGASSGIITVPYGANKTFYISAAAVDANGTESQFSTEWTLSPPAWSSST